mmetsp:Transcript_8029/g.18333  ORF Transcript_8029/g.18333 Transcript_8029/m.18333 type:complete len:364 (+) Transcript_8029:181-1272(+)
MSPRGLDDLPQRIFDGEPPTPQPHHLPLHARALHPQLSRRRLLGAAAVLLHGLSDGCGDERLVLPGGVRQRRSRLLLHAGGRSARRGRDRERRRGWHDRIDRRAGRPRLPCLTRHSRLPVRSLGPHVAHWPHEAGQPVHPRPSLLPRRPRGSASPHHSVNSCGPRGSWPALLPRRALRPRSPFLPHLSIPTVFAFQASRARKASGSVHSCLAREARGARQTRRTGGTRISLLSHVSFHTWRPVEPVLPCFARTTLRTRRTRHTRRSIFARHTIVAVPPLLPRWSRRTHFTRQTSRALLSGRSCPSLGPRLFQNMIDMLLQQILVCNQLRHSIGHACYTVAYPHVVRQIQSFAASCFKPTNFVC